ncbi:MAG: hypothetical protein COT21_02130 [Hadesarchaea archaeon CG08_land_8_20_14_0_20_51_8]|nr:MAG: hypothetical protein COT21_02130 [Hadesarchaea archaeon CG08_land_8_20_14_0_20_51_8]
MAWHKITLTPFFPLGYFEATVQAKGLLYGVALTFFTKGAGMSVGFGLLWSRTGNMIAPAFVHGWGNALPNLTQFKF